MAFRNGGNIGARRQQEKNHCSQQDPTKQPGAHTQTIVLETILAFQQQLPDIIVGSEKQKSLSS